MGTFIALLRGINVSGQKKIKMTDLRKLMQELGFEGVQTYIQSGNILFRSEEKQPGELEQKIEGLISSHYSFEVSIIVKTPSELEHVLNNNPFTEEQTDRMYITFLSKLPSSDNIQDLMNIDHYPEEFFMNEKTIYFYSPHGYGRAKMNNNFFETKLNTTATTRNWRTVNKLFEMTKDLID